jgi:hypothetical protein
MVCVWHIPYTNNPRLPQVRVEAVRLLYKSWSTRKVARYRGIPIALLLGEVIKSLAMENMED